MAGIDTVSSSLRALSIAVAVMLTAFAVCVLPSTSSEASTEKCLRIGLVERIDSLNPNVGVTTASKIFYNLVYDCLQCTGADLGNEPNLALDWEIADEFEPLGSVWDYHLTPHAKWHDGTPLTADDVVFTLNLHCQNRSQMWSSHPYTLFMNRSEKVDGLTVRVFFSDRDTGEPKPVAIADSIFIPMLPKHLLWNLTAADIAFNWDGLANDSACRLVGTGPFMATPDVKNEWLKGENITLLRNPEYHWAEDRGISVKFDKIELWFYDDALSLRNALISGEVDIADLPGEEFLEIRNLAIDGDLPDVVTCNAPANKLTHIGVRMTDSGPNPSRLDPVIRQAMAMATDKTYIVDNYYLGLADEGTTLIPPVNEEWHYEPTNDELYHYGLAAANALLENNGYKYTPESPTVRVCTADSYAVQEGLVAEGTPLVYDMAIRQEYPGDKDIAMYIESEWAKIGIDINYRIMTEAAFPPFTYFTYGYLWDLYIWDWTLPSSPNYALYIQTRDAWYGWSDNFYYSTPYDENYSRFVEEFDRNLSREYVWNCQRIHFEDLGYIVLANTHNTFAWNTGNFTGWGDWEAEPGRAIDMAWAGSSLYFDLEPVVEDDGAPLIVMAALAICALAIAVAVVVYVKRTGRT
jgi:peptide/nickel transport system substrate-binding protein